MQHYLYLQLFSVIFPVRNVLKTQKEIFINQNQLFYDYCFLLINKVL